MGKDFSYRLKEARNNIGMHQEDAARSMGMSRPTLSAIEAGKRAVTADEIRKFSDLYKVSTDWILFGNDQNEIERMHRFGKYYQLFMKLEVNEQEEILEIMKKMLQK